MTAERFCFAVFQQLARWLSITSGILADIVRMISSVLTFVQTNRSNEQADLLQALKVGVICSISAFACIHLGQQFDDIAAVWIPNGILLAALIVTKNKSTQSAMLLMNFVGAVFLNLALGRAYVSSFIFPLANLVEVVTAYVLMSRCCQQGIDFLKIPILTRFTICAGLVAPMISACIAAGAKTFQSAGQFSESFIDWFVSDSLGLLIVTPAVVLVISARDVKPSLIKRLELAALFAALVLSVIGCFVDRYPLSVFLISPILLLMACRMGPRVVSVATLVLFVTAFTAISSGMTPSLLAFSSDVALKIEFVQALILASFFTSLPVADVIDSYERTKEALRNQVATSEQLARDLLARKEHLKEQHASLQIERNRLRDAIEILPEGLVMLDSEHRYVAWNEKYVEIYSETAHLMQEGKNFETVTRTGLAQGLYPEAVGREEEWLAERLSALNNPGKPSEQLLRNGRHLRIEERRTSEGGTVGLRIDITDMKRKEKATRLLFESNPVPMLVIDMTSFAVTATNDAAKSLYGFSAADFRQIGLRDLLGDEQLGQFTTEGPLSKQGQIFKQFRRDGSSFDGELYFNRFDQEEQTSLLIAVVDITERRRAEQRADFMARHDALTALPNRTLLADRMQNAMARARRGEPAALLLLDLDNFKAVNDTYGHAVGDELLREVSKRLSASVRETDTVARLGGDEFAVLIVDADLPLGASTVARRIIASVSQPFYLGTKAISCGVSIGIAVAPRDSTDSSELFRYADLALYTAKDRGRNTFRFFKSEMDEIVQKRNTLEIDLKAAIEGDQLELDYQPIISADKNKTSSVEALVRWRHPLRGRIPPNQFIPVAEETGMIVDIGKFVVRKACMEAATWPSNIVVSVNISAIELQDRDLYETIVQALKDSGLPAERLQIEITETTLMTNVDKCVKVLSALSKIGVQIAMDDFGVGHSSLSTLRSFPFSKIKIDRAFVRDLATSSQDRAILATISELALTLGMKTTAEGIETAEQKLIVQSCGCSELQGYLFCKPISAAEIQEWFKREQVADKKLKLVAG